MLDVVIKFLLGFEIFVAVVLGFLIMIQRSKSGGGLGGLSGGGAAEEVLGAGSASMVVKATVIFSLVFLVNTLTITALEANVQKDANAVTKLLDDTPADAPGTAPAITTDTETAPAPAAAPAAGDDEADAGDTTDTVGDADPADAAAPAPVDEPAIEDPEPVAAP